MLHQLYMRRIDSIGLLLIALRDSQLRSRAYDVLHIYIRHARHLLIYRNKAFPGLQHPSHRIITRTLRIRVLLLLLVQKVTQDLDSCSGDLRVFAHDLHDGNHACY